jgi:hypothetical protein
VNKIKFETNMTTGMTSYGSTVFGTIPWRIAGSRKTLRVIREETLENKI